MRQADSWPAAAIRLRWKSSSSAKKVGASASRCAAIRARSAAMSAGVARAATASPNEAHSSASGELRGDDVLMGGDAGDEGPHLRVDVDQAFLGQRIRLSRTGVRLTPRSAASSFSDR